MYHLVCHLVISCELVAQVLLLVHPLTSKLFLMIPIKSPLRLDCPLVSTLPISRLKGIQNLSVENARGPTALTSPQQDGAEND